MNDRADFEEQEDGPDAFDASNPKHVRERKTLARVYGKRISEGLSDAMSTSQGRAFLYDILDFCGVYRSSFTGNANTFFNEGMRNVGLYLMGRITKEHPEQYIEMLKEHAK